MAKSLPNNLLPADVEARLKHVESWSDPGLKALLKRLHSRATNEPMNGDWAAVERRLYGAPERFMSVHEEWGPGFSASQVDGPEVSLFDIAGLEYCDELHDAVWGETNALELLWECPAADIIELLDFEGGPGQSDTFYWVSVRKPAALARQLRTTMVSYVKDKEQPEKPQKPISNSPARARIRKGNEPPEA